jgi:5-formyltetrahydrofolate cyclo-ligase
LGVSPNFSGSESVADKVGLLDEWKKTSVVFARPGFAQQKVREYALLDGKILIMASPKLRHGYAPVDPRMLKA